MEVFDSSVLELKEIKSCKGTDVCEMVFEGKHGGGKFNVTVNKVYMNSPEIKYRESGSTSCSPTCVIEFKVLTNVNGEFYEVDMIDLVNTSDAVKSMKIGKLYKSDNSERVIGYGDCWRVAPHSHTLSDYSLKGYSIKEAIESLRTCSFYEYSHQLSIYDLPLPMKANLTNEEVLGTWSLWNNE